MESRLNSVLLRASQALSTLLACAALSCSGQAPSSAPAPAGDVTIKPGSNPTGRQEPPSTTGPCEDWQTLDCGIELSTHGGMVDCARGVRVCQNNHYGACVADASLGVVSVQAPQATLPNEIHAGVMAVGGVSAACADDPCNPYCQKYLDTPPTPDVATRVDTPTGVLTGGTLASSNVPSGFKNKGSIDSQCSSAVGSMSYQEACQFDQHCVNGACTAYTAGESGSCMGVDITAPTTCVPSVSGYRDLTVCNRGTDAAPAGIKCYAYPGGSPQFPNNNPGIGTKLLMTTSKTLGAGECETQQIDESIFGQNGIQSVGCNPIETTTVTNTLLAYPAISSTTSGMLPWVNPGNGFASDSVDATVSPGNPNGANSGSVYPTSRDTYSSDGAWTNPDNAFASDGNFATATPAQPPGGTGTIGPTFEGLYTNPAITGDTAWTNPGNLAAADGVYATAAPGNPTTVATVTGVPSANTGVNWTNGQNTYSSNSIYATSKLTAAGTNDLFVSGFGFNLPTNAVIDEVDLSVKWKTDVNSTKYTLTAQLLTGAGNALIGTALTKSNTYTTESTDSLAVTTGLSSRVASDFTNANFKVRLRFDRASGNPADSTASVDFVQTTVKYHLSKTQADIVLQNFSLNSVPASSTVSMTAEVKWKTSAVNTNLTLGMQVYKNYGANSQAALGSEVTRVPTATTDYVDTTATLSPSAGDCVDSSFAIVLRATRAYGATNPDFTASIDYVKVNLTWTLNGASTTHSIYLKNFGLDTLIPSNATITSVTTTAKWKLSTTGTAGTLGLQAYKDGGTTALGTETTDTTSPTTLTTATQTVTTGVTAADLTDANFGVRVRVSRAPSATAPGFTASLDEVHVVVAWTSTSDDYGVTYAGFGLRSGLPADAVVTDIKTEARWKNSASNTHSLLGFQVFASNVAVGSELVDTNPSTTMTTKTQTLSGLSLTPANFGNTGFAVKVRAHRDSGSSNTDYTNDLDFVRVTVTYTTSVTSSVDECNINNNWTATKLNPSPDACQDLSTPQYAPFTVTRVFQGVCGPGQKPTWRRFGYTTSTPGSTKVEFRFHSFPAAADGTCTATMAYTSGATAAVASMTQDPQICSTTSTTCVKDLNSYLGGLPAAGNVCLQMDAYGIPASSSTPELDDWTVLYDCTDAE